MEIGKTYKVNNSVETNIFVINYLHDKQVALLKNLDNIDEYIIAHSPKILENGKVEWNSGDYYYNLTQANNKYESITLPREKYLINLKDMLDRLDGKDRFSSVVLCEMKNETKNLTQKDLECLEGAYDTFVSNDEMKLISEEIHDEIESLYRDSSEFLENLKGSSKLKDEIIDILLVEDDCEEIKAEIDSIVEYGCRRYGFRNLIYREDIEEFFDRNKEEIEDIIRKCQETMGINNENIDKLLPKFEKEDPNFQKVNNKEVASFFVVEKILSDIKDEIEDFEKQNDHSFTQELE